MEFEVGLMLAEQNKNAPDFFTYDYEMPREIARHVILSPSMHALNKGKPDTISWDLLPGCLVFHHE